MDNLASPSRDLSSPDLEVLLLFSGENERRGDLTREEPVCDGGGRPGF